MSAKKKAKKKRLFELILFTTVQSLLLPRTKHTKRNDAERQLNSKSSIIVELINCSLSGPNATLNEGFIKGKADPRAKSVKPTDKKILLDSASINKTQICDVLQGHN